MKPLALLLLVLLSSLAAADAPVARPFPPEYAARRITAEQAGGTLVDDLGAEIMALRAEIETLNAERVTLNAEVQTARAERDAALKQISAARAALGL